MWVMVFHPSWCELTEVVRWCGLGKIWNGGEGQILKELWLVLHEYAKEQFLGVDPPEQPRLPHVW
jgi:hypothetical protein